MIRSMLHPLPRSPPHSPPSSTVLCLSPPSLAHALECTLRTTYPTTSTQLPQHSCINYAYAAHMLKQAKHSHISVSQRDLMQYNIYMILLVFPSELILEITYDCLLTPQAVVQPQDPSGQWYTYHVFSLSCYMRSAALKV